MAEKKDDSAAADAGAMRIDPTLVRELAALLTENDLTEIEVEDGDRKIKVAREPAPLIAAPAAAPAPVAAAAAVTTGAGGEAPAQAPISGELVKSPMVGTAFLSPEPDSTPFVAVGQTVKAGDTLLIVEAMKVMNPITAPTAGVIKQIMIVDAHPVEFDQPLMIIG